MDTEELEGKEEVGWKKISNDIFRPPQKLNMLCSIVGAGTQLLLLIILLVSLGIVGFYYGNKGGLITAGIILYAFTSCIAGYISSSLYKYLGGDKWALNIVNTTFIFSGPVFGMWSIVNSIAWHYNSTTALPFGTIVLIFLLWVFITFPLTVIGGIRGRARQNSSILEKSKGKLPNKIPEMP